MSNTNTQAEINNLFSEWEVLEARASYLTQSSIEYPELIGFSNRLEEVMEDITKTQVRLVRSFLRAGYIGELTDNVRLGVLPKYIIQVACGRKPWKGVAA